MKALCRWGFFLAVLSSQGERVLADAKQRAASEVAEHVLQRFGAKAARGGAEGLARRIETLAARHGAEAMEAVRKVGPQAFRVAEEAGVHGNQAVRLMARHGEPAIAHVLSRPSGVAILARHGEQAAESLIRHPGIAEPLVEQFGLPAAQALRAVGTQNARRLAMMQASGELAQMGQEAPRLMEAISRYGDGCMDFVWRNKGSLLVGTGLVTFVANPEPFLNHAVRPLAEIPGQAAREAVSKTNWTAVFLVGLLAALILLAVKWRRRRVWFFGSVQEAAARTTEHSPGTWRREAGGGHNSNGSARAMGRDSDQ